MAASLHAAAPVEEVSCLKKFGQPFKIDWKAPNLLRFLPFKPLFFFLGGHVKKKSSQLRVVCMGGKMRLCF
jgi:hypothetical protein